MKASVYSSALASAKLKSLMTTSAPTYRSCTQYRYVLAGSKSGQDGLVMAERTHGVVDGEPCKGPA